LSVAGDSVQGRGIAFDPTDNSLWIQDAATTTKMFHVHTNGSNMSGAFTIAYGYEVGVAYDSSDNTLWSVAYDGAGPERFYHY
jgi:hypothetical protein